MYYKRFSDKEYTFDEAYDIIKESGNKLLIMKTYNKWTEQKEVVVTYEMIENLKKDISIPVWATKSEHWVILQPDNEKQNKANEIGNWMRDELGFILDTRFYDESNMSILNWWQQLDDHYIDEEIAYDIMKWLKETKRIKI